MRTSSDWDIHINVYMYIYILECIKINSKSCVMVGFIQSSTNAYCDMKHNCNCTSSLCTAKDSLLLNDSTDSQCFIFDGKTACIKLCT